MKLSILNYIHHFTMYDYVAYAWLTLTFFIAILLSILLAKRSIFMSILTLLFSLSILLAGPIVLKNILDNFLRPNQTNLTTYKKLTFTNVLIVDGEIINSSKKDFSLCLVNASVYKEGKNSLYKFLNKLKPFRKKSISVEKQIKVDSAQEFKIVFYDFNFDGDINVTIKSECY